MSFISFNFLYLVIALLIAYYLIFKDNQWAVLLTGSLVFYIFASPYFLIFAGISIFTTYFCGLFLGSSKNKINKRFALLVCLLINIALLATLKYTGFFMDTFVSFFNLLGFSLVAPKINFILPLGISYYTFMNISYLFDVHWGIQDSEKDFLKYALFVLYFPHITQGPIDTYSQLGNQLYAKHVFSADNFKEGIYRILFGLFKKLVIANRLAVYVDSVYNNPSSYESFTLLTATILYAIQIYCDFSGYMDEAVGISKLFDINIAENFNFPLFSHSIAEYWRRWHITLGAWFRTYVFYPVIRSKLCRRFSAYIRKKHNSSYASMMTTIIGLVCVWLLTGLWHGAGFHYITHGLFHGTIIIISTVLESKYKIIRKKLNVSIDSTWYHILQIIRTFILVDFSYIFFRANSMKDAVYIIKQIFTKMTVNSDQIKAALLPFTNDNTAVSYAAVAAISFILLLAIDSCEYKHTEFMNRHRYFMSSVFIIITALFGIFGQSSFIYMAY